MSDTPLTPYDCPECDWTGTFDDINGIHHIHHINEQIEPGELVPAGCCPDCGAMLEVEDVDVPDYTLSVVAHIQRQRGWLVFQPRPGDPHGVQAQLAERLRSGSAADIWYDAHDHGDTEKENVIDALQEDIEAAARLLERLALTGDTTRLLLERTQPVLRQLRDALAQADKVVAVRDVDTLLTDIETALKGEPS